MLSTRDILVSYMSNFKIFSSHTHIKKKQVKLILKIFYLTQYV